MPMFWWHNVLKLQLQILFYLFFGPVYFSFFFFIFFAIFYCSFTEYHFIQWYKGNCFTTFLPSLFYVPGFLQIVTWSFFITSGQNHSAIHSFGCCDKACETCATCTGGNSSQVQLGRSFLPQPVLPPHPHFRQWMQCSQACWDCHSYDHSLTHFFQNDPAYFKQFKVWFHVSFRSSKHHLLPPSASIPTSVFPSLFLFWSFASSPIANKAGFGCTGDWGSWLQDWSVGGQWQR